MDPVKEIDILEAKRTELKQQLATPGIDKDEKHDINQRIIAVDNRITALYGQPPDNRSFLRKFSDDYWGAPMFWTVFYISGSWMALRRYSIARHEFAPYTEKQLIWRQGALFFDSPTVPNAKRVCAASGFLAVVRGWTNKSPPPNWYVGVPNAKRVCAASLFLAAVCGMTNKSPPPNWNVGLEQVKQPQRSSGKGGGDDK